MTVAAEEDYCRLQLDMCCYISRRAGPQLSVCFTLSASSSYKGLFCKPFVGLGRIIFALASVVSAASNRYPYLEAEGPCKSIDLLLPVTKIGCKYCAASELNQCNSQPRLWLSFGLYGTYQCASQINHVCIATQQRDCIL